MHTQTGARVKGVYQFTRGIPIKARKNRLDCASLWEHIFVGPVF